MIWNTLLMALRAIRRNALRSFLTTLGIVIGVAAVIAMLTLGQGATAKVTADISSLGNNLLVLVPGAERRSSSGVPAPSFTLDDVRAIKEEIPTVAAVAPASGTGARVVYGNRNWTTGVTGSDNQYFTVRNWRFEAGRSFTEGELRGGSTVCVLGATVRKELFGAGAPVGASIRVGKMSCEVIGVLESKGTSTVDSDADNFVVMPLSTFQRRIAGTNTIGSISVSAVSDDATRDAKRRLESLMRQRRRVRTGEENNFRVMDLKEVAKTVEGVTSALTALLGAIAAVSLLVGGIGIMNIMLVSVTERTREIGIRLAIGARAREVLAQFLVEAVVLSTLGGVVGIILGLVGSYAGARAMGLPFLFLPTIVLGAFAFAAGVGVFFGFYPARKAARLNPIDALRYE